MSRSNINLDRDSVLALMQEIYNDCVDQKTMALQIQKKMLVFLKDIEGLALIGPIIKEQQKIIDSTIDKKLQLSKLQSTLHMKNPKSTDDLAGALGVDDMKIIEELLLKKNTVNETESKVNFDITSIKSGAENKKLE